MYDVLVVGGGAAGLSAALLLGRCRHRVLVCAAGAPRNAAAPALHGLLGHEGTPPLDLLAKGREELRRYETVTVRETRIEAIEPTTEGFAFSCSDETSGTCRRVLLATGLTDELPDIPGLADCYGLTVHHCVYCDGFEHADQPIVAFGNGDKGLGLAAMLRHWSADVVLATNGSVPADDAATLQRTKDVGISWRPQRISRLDADDGRIRQICFEDGEKVDCLAMFFCTGSHQTSDLAERLGCRRDDRGSIVVDPVTEETSVPGVYVAGDASRETLLLSVAIGEGARAAVAINRALLKEAGLLL
ncbi:MAG: NAD(P)/FAD-dependent oxidoreductase [Hyphomicrobiales bacterium]